MTAPAALPSVTPEEIYLATLTFFCIKPPEHDGHHNAVDMKAFTREMALFLLKELKVRCCPLLPTPAAAPTVLHVAAVMDACVELACFACQGQFGS